MLSSILRFEWRYHTRQVSFVAAVMLFFAAGLVLAATGFGPDNVNVNSPYSIAESAGLISLLAVFVAAAFCANAVVRDREVRMEEIVFTTSVEKLPFLLGRFGGSFFAAFTAYSASALGLLVGRLLPWHDPDRLGAIAPLDYLHALAVIGLPNVLFAAVVLFAVATTTRSVLASYAASVFLYVLYFVASAMTNSPLMAASAPGAAGDATLAALLDPFGLSAFFEQTQYWTPAERNVRTVALSGNFLLNRLVWIAASFAGFAAVFRLFSFRAASSPGKRRPAEEESVAPPATYVRAGVSGNFLQALLSASGMEVRAALRNLPFAALTLLWGALAASEILAEVVGGELGSSFHPTTALIAATIRQPLSLIGMVMVIYHGAEIVWRDRTLRFDGILNATPASSAVFVLSKWLALSSLVLVLTAVAFLVGAGVQLAYGFPPEPGLVLAFGAVNALPLILFAAVSVLVQTLSRQKYLGMMLVLVAAVLAQRGDVVGLEHPLLRVVTLPRMEWSAFNGFGDYATPWFWLALYWSAFAGLALVVAVAAWRREQPRLRLLPAVALSVALLASGAFVFFNTNVLNAWETADDVLDWKARYEKKYARYSGLPSPRIREVSAAIDLEPEARRYRVRGEYLLVNESGRPIEVLLVAVRREASSASIAIDSGAVTLDEEFNQHLIRLRPPLAPRSSARLRFDVTYDRAGFVASGPDNTVVANGSYIMSFRSLPTVGYRRSYEIEDPRERKRRGLPGQEQREATAEIATGDWARFDVTVSTAPDQVVVAPGRLLREWLQNGRRFFHFRSDTPIPNQFAIASARYAIARSVDRGVSIEVYHHPEHGVNVPLIMRAATHSLRLFSEQFGPYPHRHLRVAEVPLVWDFGGFAQPGVIILHEQRGFLIDRRGAERFDLLYRRVAHEIAHQWWGHQLVAADAPGATMLTESLTKYSELLALEEAHGARQVVRSLEAEHDLYLSGRTGETGVEPPLAQAGDQAYLYYRKGAIVMNALSDLLGERALNEALRTLLRDEGGPEGRATTAHLLANLHAVATPTQRLLIDEWMSQVVLYDLEALEAEAQRLADGRWEVTLQIDASKSGGRPLDEAIRVVVYGEDGVTAIHDARHPLRQGRNALMVRVNSVPTAFAIDPSITRIETNRLDNRKAVTLRTGNATVRTR
ncbi:MAG: M1 family aminopeptidase [Thermoanaerobaculia bacterium]